MDKQVAVLFGGRSIEHEISVITGLQVMEAIDVIRHRVRPVYVDQEGRWWTGDALKMRSFYRQFSSEHPNLHEVTLLPKPKVGGLTRLDTQEVLPVDVYILAFHGHLGEDGAIQGLMELADVAYTGCSVLSSALSMHKAHCKRLVRDAGIPVLPFLQIHRDAARTCLASLRQEILSTKGLEHFPLFVKPLQLGSSLGVSRADDLPSLDAALAKAFMIDDYAIIEPSIHALMEINVAVRPGPSPSSVEIPVASGQHLSYEDKYLRGDNKAKGHSLSDGMAGLSRVVDPHDLDAELKAQVIRYACDAYTLLECGGIVRFDFIYDLKAEKLYFNEANAIPGSLAYYLWNDELYTELLDGLIEEAEKNCMERSYAERCRPFVALA